MDPFKLMDKHYTKIVRFLTVLGLTIVVIQILLSHPDINRILVLITRLEGR